MQERKNGDDRSKEMRKQYASRFAWLKTVGNTTSSRRGWLGEHIATTALRGGHACCAQARQPVIMVGATASGPSCKKIGRKDLSCSERKARRVYARFRLAGYVRRRAGATCNHWGGATRYTRYLFVHGWRAREIL